MPEKRNISGRMRRKFLKGKDTEVKYYDGSLRRSGELDWSGELQLVRTLDLTGESGLEKLPDDIGSRAPTLMELTLAGCEALQKLPHSIGELTMLQYMDLTGCTTLSWLPSSVGCLTALRCLNITRCSKITELPPGIGLLPSLQVLEAANCARLSLLPPLHGLTSLMRLDLFGSESLPQLPPLGELTALEYIDISHCSLLTHLPESFATLRALSIFSAAHCKALRTLPDTLQGSVAMQKLDISWCEAIRQLPAGLGDLRDLRVLDLSRCSNLSALPLSFHLLTRLEELTMTGCAMLSCLPPDVGSLIRLTRLDMMSCSRLGSLPPSITQLHRLRVLNLSSCCNLQSLPEELFPAITGHSDNCARGIHTQHESASPDSLETCASADRLTIDEADDMMRYSTPGTPKDPRSATSAHLALTDFPQCHHVKAATSQSFPYNTPPGTRASIQASSSIRSSVHTPETKPADCQVDGSSAAMPHLLFLVTAGCTALQRPPALAAATAELTCRLMDLRFSSSGSNREFSRSNYSPRGNTWAAAWAGTLAQGLPNHLMPVWSTETLSFLPI